MNYQLGCSFLNYGDMMEQIGDRIRKARLAHQLTQPQLAELIGVSKGTISMWETGITTPKGANLLNLASCLKLRPAYVITGELPAEGSPPQVRITSPEGQEALDELSEIMMGLTEDERAMALELLRAWSKRKPT